MVDPASFWWLLGFGWPAEPAGVTFVRLIEGRLALLEDLGVPVGVQVTRSQVGEYLKDPETMRDHLTARGVTFPAQAQHAG